MRHFCKVISLYILLVLVSAIVIVCSLKADFLAALATASVGCIFKTFAAWGHSELFSRFVPVSGDNTSQT